MAVLIAALLVAGIAVAAVRATRTDDDQLAAPTESPTAAVTMTFTGAPPYSPTPSESPSPAETVVPGATSESPSPSDTALPRTGASSSSGGPLVVFTLLIALCGGAILARAQ